jgi:hypothetical protein
MPATAGIVIGSENYGLPTGTVILLKWIKPVSDDYLPSGLQR